MLHDAVESHPLPPRLQTLRCHSVDRPDPLISGDALIEAVWGIWRPLPTIRIRP